MYVVQHFFGFNKKVVYTAPSSKKVFTLVSDLFSWLNKKETENINPVIVAGIVHQEIAAIHPFFDGNGRTARAAATLILYKRGYDFRKLFALEDYYNRNRGKYYQAINIGKNYEERKQDMTVWLGKKGTYPEYIVISSQFLKSCHKSFLGDNRNCRVNNIY